ncbi:MAG: hypothetical protein F6J86_19065 [Symploca sp. SIO1B1]|nr:hypothetical protein [Symploca sp. SIO1C2]NER95912.1 hypothetical protein [Symploca sp. SIO1B1]
MINSFEQIWLIGFRFNPNYTAPDFYTLLLEEKEEQPISSNGQIILFQDPDYAQAALELDSEFSTLSSQIAPTEVYLNLDFANMLYTISSENYDESGGIIECLNTLFDMLKCASISIPSHYKEKLFSLANHLTFDKDFSVLFVENESLRNSTVEAIQWAIGAVISKSTFFSKKTLAFR